MKISKMSWHYRFMKQVGGYDFEEPGTLCAYFWMFVFCCLKALVISFMLLSAIIISLGVLYAAIYKHDPHAKIICFFVLGFVSFIFLLALYDHLRRRFNTSTGIIGIVFGIIKAAKNKACPLIEYVKN